MDRKKKKVPGVPTRTVDSVKDERFKHVLKNPVFRPVPKKEKKIEIDKRFQAMFNDEKFKLKYKVDKRGRPVETTTDENLRRYYNLEEGEDTGEQLSKKTARGKQDRKKPVEKDGRDIEESSEEESDSDSEVEGDVKEEEMTRTVTKLKLDEVTRKKLHSSEIDYARGEADLDSSDDSSSDSDSTNEDENEELLDHDWGELDKNASRTEEGTKRMAVCNMDWDRVRAVDLMVLLSSFVPQGGLIKSVKIYPSEFGKQRMAEEEVQGPKELVGDRVKVEKFSDDEDNQDDGDGSTNSNSDDEESEGKEYHREKLRQYQLNRLKYYYAVIEFDSVQTSEKVYSECDGMEYESSAAKIDLRFVPDDMVFDDEPKDVCTALPESTKYRPRFFTTTALQQVKVDLTWDETDPMRKELTEKAFDPKGKVDDDDLRAYLAVSSESEETDDDEPDTEETIEVAQQKSSTQDAISKYKSLLQSIESAEQQKKNKDVEMEITWGVGLKETTEKLVKKKIEEEEKSKRTPWEELIDKQKDKKKQRKQERKRKVSKNDSDSSGDEAEQQPFSDDDVDVDMTDDFFRNEMKNNEIFKDSIKKSVKNKKSEDTKEKSKQVKDASLELLLMDEDDLSNRKHFSLKKILENENDSKAKKKRKMKKRKLNLEESVNSTTKDDFEIDVGDTRFSALFSSHHFNVDPSDPNFKKTKAMEKIISEKQKRRAGETANADTKAASVMGTEDNIDSKPQVSKKAELSYLVKSIKRNTQNLKTKSKNKIRR